MVSAETNQVDHQDIENLVEKSSSGEVLTQAEEARGKQQVKFVQKSADMPAGHYNAAKEFYKSLNTADGRTLWDARKDIQ